MRKITTFLICFLFCSAFLFSQNKKNISKNIEKWINENFSGDRTPFNNGKYVFVAFTSINNGVLKQKNYKKVFDTKYAFMNDNSKMTLNLKDLYYDSVTYTLDEGQYFIYAKCKNNVFCSKSVNEKGEVNGSETPLLGMIEKNKTDINKCIEAFTKVIKIYSNNKQFNW